MTIEIRASKTLPSGIAVTKGRLICCADAASDCFGPVDTIYLVDDREWDGSASCQNQVHVTLVRYGLREDYDHE